MFHLSSLFQDDNLAFSTDRASHNFDNLSNDFKSLIPVKTLDNHHKDLPFSINACGDGYPSTLNDIFPFLEHLDLYNIDSEPISHNLQSSFV